MKYSDYLNTAHWKQRREDFKKGRLKNKCRICQSEANLQVHHKRYKAPGKHGTSILFAERNRDLMTLCNECHQAIHQNGLQVVVTKGLFRINVLKHALRDKNPREFLYNRRGRLGPQQLRTFNRIVKIDTPQEGAKLS